MGCGLFDRYPKNNQGYYERHYICCGPIALEMAFQELYRKNGIYPFRAITRKEISQHMQSDGMPFKEILALFNKEAICITWPKEIKQSASKYGFEPINIKEFSQLDPMKDVAIILVHSNLSNFHWLCFPIHKNIKEWYGKGTKIDKIYLLKLK